MCVVLGSRPCIVVSTAAVAKEVYKTNDANFASRPKFYSWTVWNDGNKVTNMVSAAYGPHWRQLRKFTNTELLSPKQFASQRSIRADEVHFMIKLVLDEVRQNENRAVIDLKRWAYGLSSNHMTRIINGRR